MAGLRALADRGLFYLHKVTDPRLFTDLGARPNLRVAFRSRLAATLLEMAREGQGVAWVPLSLAERELAEGRLSRVGGPEFDVPVDIDLIRPAAALSGHSEGFWRRVAATTEAPAR